MERGVSRRSFLRTAAIGAAAIPIATTITARAQSGAATVPVVAANATETWSEPWVWRPSTWPGQQLTLNVVENENPAAVIGFGNPGEVLFSYNGATPGPSIRMSGDEILYLRLRNMLGRDYGTTYVGAFPDPNELPSNLALSDVQAKSTQLGNKRSDFCLGEHTNGVHSVRVTNLHTHGLHVQPGRNADGTHSDNVILRLIDNADYNRRQQEVDSPACAWIREPEQTTFLRDDEQTGYADYEFRIGNIQVDPLGPPAAQPHPPGTHWYHPHCHGATHNQVASGMAGFLVVEGDVDAAINLELAGSSSADPQTKTGTYDYIERLMLIQRVLVTTVDPDATTQSLKQRNTISLSVNGSSTPKVITMRQGAIERWRVLNGSVDGKGYKRFMVVKGQYDTVAVTSGNSTSQQLVKVTDSSTGDYTPATRAAVSADKQQLYQLAFDGITLVEGEGDDCQYTIRDLAQQNPGTTNPLDGDINSTTPNQSMLANFQACYADAQSIVDCYVRPNEVYMAPGNRTDLFFKAPRDPGIYTVLTRGVVVHADNYQATLQKAYNSSTLSPAPEDIIVAYIVVQEDAAGASPIPDYDIMDLVAKLPPVPPYLRPITDSDVQIKAAANGNPADPDADVPGRVGKYRTRAMAYSGWGSADYPLVTTIGDSDTAKNFKAFVAADQAAGADLENLRYAAIDGSPGEYVLLPANTRTMAISTTMTDEIVDDSDPMFPISKATGRKFNPNDPQRPQMLESTAEEWAVYNYSMSLWFDMSTSPTGQYNAHYPGQPLIRADGQAKFAADPANWRLQSKGVDHPFHIHQNPCWVLRIEVPDENGNLVNILDKPRWQDVAWLPRNGGRIVFRSRFPDYIGTFVNHCHILLHEDNGMMQVVEITPFADLANYEMQDAVASAGASAEAVSQIYPRFDQARAWLQNMQFVDPNATTGQTYPGFAFGSPPS